MTHPRLHAGVSPDKPAVIMADGSPGLTYGELEDRANRGAHLLRELGVKQGETIAYWLPNCPEVYEVYWAGQRAGCYITPIATALTAEEADYIVGNSGAKLLVTDSSIPGLAALPPRDGVAVMSREEWRAALDRQPAGPIADEAPGFHMVYSSGTTGRPKGIVHGHGGVLLEHLKAAGLHAGLGPDDVFFWQTALSWMMWNFRLAGLLCGSTVVCYSGHPMHPNADRLWELVQTEQVTYFGTSPGHLLASRKAGLHPGVEHDLSRLHTLGSTGSPLPADLFEWVKAEVGAHVEVSSVSGGTDVVTAFAGGTTGVPALPGELATRYLGVDLHSWSPRREPLIGEVGELVITTPMPSMPIGFWDDADGSRYRAAYFDHEWADGPDSPDKESGVWRHGDWLTVTERGSLVIHGRSDATLNRHGIRMGSADIYEVVEGIDAVSEAFVLGIDGPDGAYWMPLFVTLAEGHQLDAGLTDAIRTRIRTTLSPRHVPDDVIAAPGIPHTRTGKKLEVPVTAIMAGHTDVSLDPRSIDRPELIEWYREQGRRHWS